MTTAMENLQGQCRKTPYNAKNQPQREPPRLIDSLNMIMRLDCQIQ